MTNLKNKNIIVTGASGGIGNSIVETLSMCGANIVASGTNQEKLEKLKSKFDDIIHLISNPTRLMGLNFIIGFFRGLGFSLALLIILLIILASISDISFLGL